MRTLASVTLSAVLFLGFAAPVFAQEPPKPDEKKPAEGDQPRPDRRQGRQGRQGRGGMGGLNVNDLKEKLGLSEEQVKKVEGIAADMRADFEKMREEFQGGGGFDREKMREYFTKAQATVKEKMNGILTDEQKPKYEAYVKEQEARRGQFGQGGQNGRRNRQNGQGGPNGDNTGRGPDRGRRLYDQAERSLTLSAEEKAAVLPLVQKIIDARNEAQKHRDEFNAYVTKAAASSTTEEQKAEISGKLGEFRKVREADQQKIKDAQQAVREVLTVDNEAKLVALGLLD